MDWYFELFLIFFFLLLKAFFSGSEIAMVNSDKVKLRHLAKTGDRGAGLLADGSPAGGRGGARHGAVHVRGRHAGGDCHGDWVSDCWAFIG